jgi:hypothetical protein
MIAVAMTAMSGVCTASALAASNSPSPSWTVESLAQPTEFQAGERRDAYVVRATNVGGAPASGTTMIVDELPPGVTIDESSGEKEVRAVDGASLAPLTCSYEPATAATIVTCTYTGTVASADALFLEITVDVASTVTADSLTNVVTVSGGEAAAVSSQTQTPVGAAPTPFGIGAFNFGVEDAEGATDTQAGDRPNLLTTSFNFPIGATRTASGLLRVEDVKNVMVDLPLGLVGDPQALPQCPESAVAEGTETSACPSGSQVGFISYREDGSGNSQLTPIYNVIPEIGYPAEFGFNYLARGIMMYASVVRTASGYGLRVAVPGLTTFSELTSASLAFFGDPAVRDDGGATGSEAFLTNPTRCASEPLTARIEADSWENPSVYVSSESTVYPQITGCDMLQFQAALEVAPEAQARQADEPAGYEVNLKVPQAPDFGPVLAAPDLKDATVRLPAGVSVSPSAADGLEGCYAEGPRGINIGSGNLGPEGRDLGDPEATELGAGHAGGNASPYDDRLYHTAPGHCPAGSTLGTVEVETPLLPAHMLTGHIYLAQPQCGGTGQPGCTEASATNGELYGLYLEVEGAGVLIKLKGKVEANSATGQLTTTFAENPQLPFSELKLHLKGGPRAPLANPQSCGTYTTESNLTPWSAPVTPDATPSSSFPITGCAGSPFAPSFSAGTVIPSAGAYSPFTLTFSRKDGEQDLSGLTVTTPPGLLGKIAGVSQCPEAQANAGTCGPESQIGTTTVASGSGSAPLYLTGRVYLTGPYGGGPFGLSIVVPAVAGPFNLGNVVVRASIAINPVTAAITTTSNPLPQMIDGVPTRLQTVNVTLDRPGFIFNPTNCDAQAVTGTITSAQGTSVGVSSPFAAAGCANLPFKPTFAVSSQGQASKADGASLDVKVTSGTGQANIGMVKVDLPKQFPSRLTTLQKACLASVFEANPAGCPKESDVGTATAVTPVLAHPLIGPAYLVSHGGAAFPDLEIVLQGEGITLVLDGQTDIKKGVTSSMFRSVPDAPISTFELKLPTGPYSVLGANLPASAKYSLCGQTLAMPTEITGQNGAVVKQTTKIALAGCAKAKALTRAQKLVNALRTCRTKSKGKRAGCEKRARKQYAVAKAGAKIKDNKQH